jgi:hypothetical protein
MNQQLIDFYFYSLQSIEDDDRLKGFLLTTMCVLWTADACNTHILRSNDNEICLTLPIEKI